mmetsp:Transcript_128152/g.358769  ORF Transcript_128152/g.358769 Transcript_128152/m.358769 type:complete len:94 (-) Transcript_128152:324-605(-)
MPSVKKICKIDGEKVHTTEELLKVIQQEVATEEHKSGSLTDILNTSGGIDIVWQNADISAEKLGKDFEKIVETIRDHGPDGARPTDNVHLFLN